MDSDVETLYADSDTTTFDWDDLEFELNRMNLSAECARSVDEDLYEGEENLKLNVSLYSQVSEPKRYSYGFESSQSEDSETPVSSSALSTLSSHPPRPFTFSQSDDSFIGEFHISQEREELCAEEEGPEDEPESKRMKNRIFETKHQFKKEEEFLNWFEKENEKWIKGVKHATKRGIVQSYDCAFSKKRKNYNCLAGMRVIYFDTSPEVAVEYSTEPHNHIPTGTPILSDDVKDYIRKKMKETIVPLPKNILNEMIKNNIAGPELTLTHIYNFMAAEKKRNVPKEQNMITVNDLLQYCRSKQSTSGPDSPYVFSYHLNENPQEILVTWTTPKLLNCLKNQPLLQLDATHKVMWHRFPVFVLGYSDLHHHFHPVFIAMSNSESALTYERIMHAIKSKANYIPTYLLADGDDAITAGVKKIFENIIRIMCYFHFKKNIKEKIKIIKDEKIQEEILNDINLLHHAMNPPQFDSASDKMLQHWNQQYKSKKDVLTFVNYFKSEWINSANRGWYQGIYKLVVNNNGVEACNNSIKNHFTFRRRLSLEDFVNVVEDMLLVWSKSVKEDPIRPEIPLIAFDNGYKLRSQILAEERFIRTYHGAYLIPSSAIDGQVDSEDYKSWFQNIAQNGFTTWQQYKQDRHRFHMVFKEHDWYYCTCQVGKTKDCCKHCVVILEQNGVIQYPPETMSKPISQKRKRGRPPKAKAGTSLQCD